MHSFFTEWEPTSIAPSNRDLEICVLDYDGIVHTFPLACHKDGPNWVDARGNRHVDIQPTHWRKWGEFRRSTR
jgi:hypothetical protein